jgi:hypothetical protein
MDRVWFQLPGPAGFIESVAVSVDSGRNVVVSAPHALTDSLRDALRHRLASGSRAWYHLASPIGGSHNPVEVIRQSCVGVDDRDSVLDVATLSRCPSFSSYIIWVEPTSCSAARWREFIPDYAQACRVRDEVDRAVFCLLLHDPEIHSTLREEVTLSLHTWDGQLSGLDVWAFVRHRRQTSGLHPWFDYLAGSLIAELAAFDMTLAEFLSSRDLTELLSPMPLLVEYAHRCEWKGTHCRHPSWAEGQIGRTDHGMMIHLALSALDGNRDAVDRRIWQSQVRVLFPLLEEMRLWLVPEASRLIRPPFVSLIKGQQVVINSVDDLELGQLEYQLSSTRLYPRVHCLAEMRRNLAHIRPVPANSLLAVEFQAMLRDYHNGTAAPQ